MKDRIIALMSDWGLKDGSVGSVKGVILGINPRATIVDISHDVESFDVKQGAFLLMAHYQTYPKGTIFMAVIDPGVGTKRKAILVDTGDYFFLGPNNGVLSWAFQLPYVRSVIDITNEAYFRKPVSFAFHGRDIFAPVAAYLSRGYSPFKFGEGIKPSDIILADYPLEMEDKRIIGEILYIDGFGNLITSIRKEDFDFITKEAKENLTLVVGQTVISKLSRTY